MYTQKTILLLGSGELGKELVISLKRYGMRVIAVDSYADAPAMQVADQAVVIDMLDAEALRSTIEEAQADFIVPEIEAIRTELLYEMEESGYTVVPSARAVNYTMNRKAIRDLAAQELGIRTAEYRYAKSQEELQLAVHQLGMPCVVKPLMSSSGKGQSVVKSDADIEKAWTSAIEGSRGDLAEVIVESFVDFDVEITLLTVTQVSGETLYCPSIGHVQDGGDYVYSWQPARIAIEDLREAQEMAQKITSSLGGAGIWGVEFFVAEDGVYFSELSPRPHDTGMVTLAGTQNLNEFELHARAFMGYPIPEIKLEKIGVSAALRAQENSENYAFTGLDSCLENGQVDVRIFGKPTTRPGRRMGVLLLHDTLDGDMQALRELAEMEKKKVQISYPDAS